MALGRTNSLSINTGASNSIFAQQQQQQQNQGSTTSNLFGGNPQANQTQASGSLFGGNMQSSQAQPTSNIFGSSTNPPSQPQQSSGLFGSLNAQNQNSQITSSGGANSGQQNQGSSGLFGSNNINTQQNPTTGSLFGGNSQTNQVAGGLFGGNSTQQTSNASNLFGRTGGGASSTFSQQAPALNSLFGGSTLAASSSATTTTAQPLQQTPSLLSATQHNQMNQAAPFGRLSMGQASTVPTTVGAVKVDLNDLRPTTRFDDCTDAVKQQLEEIERMIQQQESYAKQIEAFLPKHEENIESLTPDIEYVKSKAEDAEQALAADAYGVDGQRKKVEKDGKDAERVVRVSDNLKLPHGYQYSNMNVGGFGGMYNSPLRPPQAPSGGESEEYDTDLIGNYFVPMAAELQQRMLAYANNLAEIESHMRVIESSAVGQAQQLIQRKAGVQGGSAQASSEDTVRELASTLRGFEQSILGVAGVLGECREGVNQLVLGRLSSTIG